MVLSLGLKAFFPTSLLQLTASSGWELSENRSWRRTARRPTEVKVLGKSKGKATEGGTDTVAEWSKSSDRHRKLSKN